MQYLLAPFRFLYKLYFAVIFGVTLLLFFPFFFFAFQFGSGFKAGFRLKRIWSKVLEFLLFTPMRIKGKDQFPKDTAYVICANHSSYLDIMLMYGVVPARFKFLGKIELMRIPILKYVFGKMDIPVERQNARKAARSLDRCAEELKCGNSIAIFPEGGMPLESPVLQRFKNGAFKLAIENQVPIVPITFINNYELFYDHTDLFFNGRPGIAKVQVHPPIETKGMTLDDLVYLRQQTFEVINSSLEQKG